MPELLLPLDGRLVAHTIARSCAYKHPLAPLQSRIAYSDAHVVADPIADPIAEACEEIYSRILQQLNQPAILHWLGVIVDNAGQINGIKISLLDKKREEDMHRLVPAGVSMSTGDEFNYDELIGGDATHHNDALPGIFDGIAAAQSARRISHLAKLLVLAGDAGVLPDPDLACHRMGLLHELAGIQ